MNCQKTDKQAMYDIFFGIFLCVQNFILPVFFDFYDILFIGKHRVGMLFLYFFFPFYVSYIYWDKGKWGKARIPEFSEGWLEISLFARTDAEPD